jgi:hypothetical protein
VKTSDAAARIDGSRLRDTGAGADRGGRSWDGVVPAEDVARNVGSARFSVAEAGWAALRPDLPADMIDLLAPPVLVTAAAFPSVPRRTAGRHRRG